MNLKIKTSDGDPFISRKRILLSISPEDLIIYFFIEHFLSVIRISKTFV